MPVHAVSALERLFRSATNGAQISSAVSGPAQRFTTGATSGTEEIVHACTRCCPDRSDRRGRCTSLPGWRARRHRPAVSRGSGADDVTLRWTATIPTYTVFRSTNPATVTDPGNSPGLPAATSGSTHRLPAACSSTTWRATVPAARSPAAGRDLDRTDTSTVKTTVRPGQHGRPTRTATSGTLRLLPERSGEGRSRPVRLFQGRGRGRQRSTTASSTATTSVRAATTPWTPTAAACRMRAIRARRGCAASPCRTGSTPSCRATRRCASRGTAGGSRRASPAHNRGVLIPTERFIANPSDTSYYEYMGDETVNDIRGFSDDDNLVLAEHQHLRPASGVQGRRRGDLRPDQRQLEGSGSVRRRHQHRRVPVLQRWPATSPRTARSSSAGRRRSSNPASYVGFRYDVAADAWQLFGGPEGKVRAVEGVSGDGSRIVGSEDRSGGGETGVIWTYQPPSVYSPQWMDDLVWPMTSRSTGRRRRCRRGIARTAGQPQGDSQQLGPGTLDPTWGVKAVAISDGGNLVAGYHVVHAVKRIAVHVGPGRGLRQPLRLPDYGADSQPSQLGHFSNSFLPLDLSGDGRVIVGRTGALSGLARLGRDHAELGSSVLSKNERTTAGCGAVVRR